MDVCHLASTEGVKFGTYKGESVVIKRVSPKDTEYINTHCKFNHPCLVSAKLYQGICDSNTLVMFLEPALINLNDFIKYTRKDIEYFNKSEMYADDLIRGLMYLHANGLSHNRINVYHCLIKPEGCALTDFKYVTPITQQSIRDDNKSLGKVFVHMFTFDEFGNVNDYTSKFERKMPYQDLLFGRGYTIKDVSYEIDDPKFIFNESEYKSRAYEIYRQMKSDDSLEFYFLCLHNLHRSSASPEDIIAFTEYSMGIREPNKQIIKMIHEFKGKLIPNTFYHSLKNIEEINRDYMLIFSKDYTSKKYSWIPKPDYKMSDLKNGGRFIEL